MLDAFYSTYGLLIHLPPIGMVLLLMMVVFNSRLSCENHRHLPYFYDIPENGRMMGQMFGLMEFHSEFSCNHRFESRLQFGQRVAIYSFTHWVFAR